MPEPRPERDRVTSKEEPVSQEVIEKKREKSVKCLGKSAAFA